LFQVSRLIRGINQLRDPALLQINSLQCLLLQQFQGYLQPISSQLFLFKLQSVLRDIPTTFTFVPTAALHGFKVPRFSHLNLSVYCEVLNSLVVDEL
jgi:hypothetical protein